MCMTWVQISSDNPPPFFYSHLLTHVHTGTHKHTHTQYIYKYKYTHKYTYTLPHRNTCTKNTHTHTHVYTHTHMYTRLHIAAHVRMYPISERRWVHNLIVRALNIHYTFLYTNNTFLSNLMTIERAVTFRL